MLACLSNDALNDTAFELLRPQNSRTAAFIVSTPGLIGIPESFITILTLIFVCRR